MENQITEGCKREKNVSTSKKETHKELMKDATSVEELGEKQESNTKICDKKI